MRAGRLLLDLVLAAAVLPAESVNPATTPQTAPMTAEEKKNLELALNWWREVVQAHHHELVPNYLAQKYIDHDPNMGANAYWQLLVIGGSPLEGPIPVKLTNPPVVAGAKGDFVWLVWEHEDRDPRNRTNSYHFNSFDVLRIDNGKIQEHWDSAQRAPQSPAFTHGVSPKAPMAWNTGKLSAEEKKTLATSTEELKDMLQYGHLELADKTMDSGYIQHNPRVPQGRDGFKQFMSRVPGRTPEKIKPEWKNAPVLTLINGPYSFMMWDRQSKDPADPSKDSVWNHFDVVRVENGLIKEHWDEAVLVADSPITPR